ncbi:MAG: oligosaccharide flippase family protein [Verrucomicrobia bacterium]|nr:oligosaccharide flippase family protein [Verrucomicrobiota bacterium]MDA1065132.1 oligosaccharide flippase family protein [Verrucomicrobiota bacterium]
MTKQFAVLFNKAGSMVFWRMSALILSLGSSVWIARCLGPTELGRAGFIIATTSQVLLLISVCPDAYAVRKLKESGDVDDTLTLVVTARALFSMLYIAILGVFFAFGVIPATWAGLVFLGMIIPILLTFQPVWLLQAQENQPAQYKSGALVALVAFIFVVGFIRPGDFASKDLISRFLGLSAGVWAAWWMTGKGNPLKYVSLRQCSRALIYAWNGRSIYLTQIIIYIYVGLELPMLGYLVSVDELGMYRTATQLVIAVNSFFAMVPLLLYPRFIEWQKQSLGYLWEQQKKIFRLLLAAAIPLGVIFLVVGPLVYQYLYGSAYAQVGLPFGILMCSKLIVLLNGVFAWGLWAISKDSAMLIVFSGVAVFSLCSNLIFIPKYGMLAAALVNFSSETLILLLTSWMIWKAVLENRNSEPRPFA